jgi:hypothetical protein
MYALVSPRAAASATIGGVLMIANLYLLVVIGKAIVGLAQGGGSAVKIGAAMAPFKLLFLMLVVYLLMTQIRLDLLGFMAGVLTQLAAIFIETGRVSMRRSRLLLEERQA